MILFGDILYNKLNSNILQKKSWQLRENYGAWNSYQVMFLATNNEGFINKLNWSDDLEDDESYL